MVLVTINLIRFFLNKLEIYRQTLNFFCGSEENKLKIKSWRNKTHKVFHAMTILFSSIHLLWRFLCLFFTLVWLWSWWLVSQSVGEFVINWEMERELILVEIDGKLLDQHWAKPISCLTYFKFAFRFVSFLYFFFYYLFYFFQAHFSILWHLKFTNNMAKDVLPQVEDVIGLCKPSFVQIFKHHVGTIENEKLKQKMTIQLILIHKSRNRTIQMHESANKRINQLIKIKITHSKTQKTTIACNFIDHTSRRYKNKNKYDKET